MTKAIPLPGDVMMERGKLEFVVGLFVLVGILCLGYLAIKLGKLELVGGIIMNSQRTFHRVPV